MEKLNSAIDYHDVRYSERRWKLPTHSFSSQQQSQFQQRFFLQFMVLEKDSSELKGFSRQQWYNNLTCYTQQGFLGPKTS